MYNVYSALSSNSWAKWYQFTNDMKEKKHVVAIDSNKLLTVIGNIKYMFGY